MKDDCVIILYEIKQICTEAWKRRYNNVRRIWRCCIVGELLLGQNISEQNCCKIMLYFWCAKTNVYCCAMVSKKRSTIIVVGGRRMSTSLSLEEERQCCVRSDRRDHDTDDKGVTHRWPIYYIPLGFELPSQLWCTIIRFRTGKRRCAASLVRCN